MERRGGLDPFRVEGIFKNLPLHVEKSPATRRGRYLGGIFVVIAISLLRKRLRGSAWQFRAHLVCRFSFSLDFVALGRRISSGNTRYYLLKTGWQKIAFVPTAIF